MKFFIECKKSSNGKTLDFYAVQGNNSYYLFDQRYRQSVYEYFRNSLPVSVALDHSKANRNTALINAQSISSNFIRRKEENEPQ